MSSLPSLAFVVDFFATPGTRRRWSSWATNADGFKIPGDPVDLPAAGNFFPATGDTLARLNLQDMAGLQEVHTSTELRRGDPAGSFPADSWIVGGREYTVVGVGTWLRDSGQSDVFVAVLQEVKP